MRVKLKNSVISFSVTPSDANFRKNLTRHKSSTKEIAVLSVEDRNIQAYIFNKTIHFGF